MSGRERNKPCWCGSGKKYKVCHLRREEEARPTLWELDKGLRRLQDCKRCLHPKAGSDCEGGIVRAHTVRRSADLKAIARNGHVYRAMAKLPTLVETGGRIVPELLGINKASTFWGFCQGHDRTTFAPLELEPLLPTRQQAFLLAYRALAKELYAKLRQRESLGLVRDSAKGRSIERQFQIREYALLTEIGVGQAVSDLEHHKKNFDSDLLSSDFSNTRYVALQLDRAPDVVCSGMNQPHFSFAGQRLQDLASIGAVLDFVSFALVATDKGGAAVFAWRADSDRSASALVDSLLALPTSDLPHALVRYAFSEFENLFYSPRWWESLEPQVRMVLEERIHHGVGLRELPPAYLTDDGVRTVDWVVTGIQQVRE